MLAGLYCKITYYYRRWLARREVDLIRDGWGDRVPELRRLVAAGVPWEATGISEAEATKRFEAFEPAMAACEDRMAALFRRKPSTR